MSNSDSESIDYSTFDNKKRYGLGTYPKQSKEDAMLGIFADDGRKAEKIREMKSDRLHQRMSFVEATQSREDEKKVNQNSNDADSDEDHMGDGSGNEFTLDESDDENGGFSVRKARKSSSNSSDEDIDSDESDDEHHAYFDYSSFKGGNENRDDYIDEELDRKFGHRSVDAQEAKHHISLHPVTGQSDDSSLKEPVGSIKFEKGGDSKFQSRFFSREGSLSSKLSSGISEPSDISDNVINRDVAGINLISSGAQNRASDPNSGIGVKTEMDYVKIAKDFVQKHIRSGSAATFLIKYLTKNKFEGRLGKNNDGISRSIQVKVRPTNLGLGYGGFREASRLKANRELRKEYRESKGGLNAGPVNPEFVFSDEEEDEESEEEQNLYSDDDGGFTRLTRDEKRALRNLGILEEKPASASSVSSERVQRKKKSSDLYLSAADYVASLQAEIGAVSSITGTAVGVGRVIDMRGPASVTQDKLGSNSLRAQISDFLENEATAYSSHGKELLHNVSVLAGAAQTELRDCVRRRRMLELRQKEFSRREDTLRAELASLRSTESSLVRLVADVHNLASSVTQATLSGESASNTSKLSSIMSRYSGSTMNDYFDEGEHGRSGLVVNKDSATLQSLKAGKGLLKSISEIENRSPQAFWSNALVQLVPLVTQAILQHIVKNGWIPSFSPASTTRNTVLLSSEESSLREELPQVSSDTISVLMFLELGERLLRRLGLRAVELGTAPDGSTPTPVSEGLDEESYHQKGIFGHNIIVSESHAMKGQESAQLGKKSALRLDFFARHFFDASRSFQRCARDFVAVPISRLLARSVNSISKSVRSSEVLLPIDSSDSDTVVRLLRLVRPFKTFETCAAAAAVSLADYKSLSSTFSKSNQFDNLSGSRPSSCLLSLFHSLPGSSSTTDLSNRIGFLSEADFTQFQNEILHTYCSRLSTWSAAVDTEPLVRWLGPLITYSSSSLVPATLASTFYASIISAFQRALADWHPSDPSAAVLIGDLVKVIPRGTESESVISLQSQFDSVVLEGEIISRLSSVCREVDVRFLTEEGPTAAKQLISATNIDPHTLSSLLSSKLNHSFVEPLRWLDVWSSILPESFLVNLWAGECLPRFLVSAGGFSVIADAVTSSDLLDEGKKHILLKGLIACYKQWFLSLRACVPGKLLHSKPIYEAFAFLLSVPRPFMMRDLTKSKEELPSYSSFCASKISSASEISIVRRTNDALPFVLSAMSGLEPSKVTPSTFSYKVMKHAHLSKTRTPLASHTFSKAAAASSSTVSSQKSSASVKADEKVTFREIVESYLADSGLTMISTGLSYQGSPLYTAHRDVSGKKDRKVSFYFSNGVIYILNDAESPSPISIEDLINILLY